MFSLVLSACAGLEDDGSVEEDEVVMSEHAQQPAPQAATSGKWGSASSSDRDSGYTPGYSSGLLSPHSGATDTNRKSPWLPAVSSSGHVVHNVRHHRPGDFVTGVLNYSFSF